MQFLSTLSIMAAGLSSVAYAGTCTKNLELGPSYYWLIAQEGVEDIPGICGGLWDNLNGAGECGVSGGETYCREKAGQPGVLEWSFITPQTCNGGMVESAWWEATRNKFGAIECRQ